MGHILSLSIGPNDLIYSKILKYFDHFRFVANKLESLFNKDQGVGQGSNRQESTLSGFPMLDAWMGRTTTPYRREEFSKQLLIGDVLVCRAIVLLERGNHKNLLFFNLIFVEPTGLGLESHP